MLKRVVALISALTVLAGCALNAGTAFAEQYETYLDTVPEVDSYQVRGNNDLPASGSADTTVTLKDGLTDAEVAGTISDLASHRVDEQVSHHRLSIRFSTANGAGKQILASVSFDITKKSPPVSVDQAATAADRVRGFAAADPDLSDVTTGVDSIRVTTAGDPFDLADRVNDLLADESAEFYQITASTEVGHVSLFAGDPVDALRPITQVLDALPDGLEPARWRATSQNADRDPLFEIALPAGASDDVVSALEAAAQSAGIEVEVTVAIS